MDAPQAHAGNTGEGAGPSTATITDPNAHAVGQGKSGDRRAAVNAYIEEVLTQRGKRITRTHIWKQAGYKTRTEFEKWERNDPKKVNKTANERFTAILTQKPHLK